MKKVVEDILKEYEVADAKTLAQVLLDRDWEFRGSLDFQELDDKSRTEYLNAVLGKYNEAINADDSNFHLHYRRADLLRLLNRKSDAIDDFIRCTVINPHDGWAHNSLGDLMKEVGRISEAKDRFRVGIDMAPHLIWNYLDLADIEESEGNIQAAFAVLKQASRIDASDIWLNYKLGELFLKTSDYEHAAKCFGVVASSNDDFRIVDISKDRLKEINSRISIEGYNNIALVVEQIKATLVAQLDEVTHYTSLSAACAMLFKNSAFRVSEASYLNDTSEGKPLLKYLSIDQQHSGMMLDNYPTFSNKPFIGSFVSPELDNDLTLWRMYGKDHNEEARGCSITFSTVRLVESIVSSSTIALPKSESVVNEMLSDYQELRKQLTFYHVAYMDREGKVSFSGTADQNTHLNEHLSTLKNLIDSLGRDRMDQSIYNTLNLLSYLFKDSIYQHEKEVRLVMTGVGFNATIDQSSTPPRVYLQLGSVPKTINRIVLGPKVNRSEEWASSFYHHFKSMGEDVIIATSLLPYK